MKKFALASIVLVIFIMGVYFGLEKEKKERPLKIAESCWDFNLKSRLKKADLDVRVFFGYKDTRPARFVADRYESLLFVQALTRSCNEEQSACGFESDEANSDFETEIYSKIIEAPDGYEKKIRIAVYSSSAGADDEDNQKNPFQKWKSQSTKLAFTEGLKKADVVFYNGHSRAGGGPDFGSPKLNSNRHVDYQWYQNKQPGFQLMTNCLKNASASPLKMVGLFSCQSKQHFAKQLEKSKAGLEVISNETLLYFSDAINESLKALSEIMKLKCHSQ